MLLKPRQGKYPLGLEDRDINRSAAEFMMVISDLLVLLCPSPVMMYLGAFLYIFVEICLLKTCILGAVTVCGLFPGNGMLIVLGTIDANIYLHL